MTNEQSRIENDKQMSDMAKVGCLYSYTNICVPLATALVLPFIDNTKAIASSQSHEIPYSINTQAHLNVAGRINLGSFYTPAKYVAMIGEWLMKHGVNEEWTIADLSCGYGAFFELQEVKGLDKCHYVGNDIDKKAVETGRKYFPKVQWMEKNALFNISRERFNFTQDEKLAIVGNPPYNDITSQINQNIKTNSVAIDFDIKTRDLGMSSLLAYNKLKADYVAVLHPLSYLIKKGNFKATSHFFSNYRILEHIVFASKEFANTSKTTAFPIIAALYKRDENQGLSYNDIYKMRFRTVEGDTFSLDSFDYITDYVSKYPGSVRYKQEILFYTMRDINALKRSRTFIKDRIANAVDIDPSKLAYYCYIDCFKRYAETPYWMGNFNVPFVKSEFDSITEAIIKDAKHHHPEIFGICPTTNSTDAELIRKYIKKSIRGKK